MICGCSPRFEFQGLDLQQAILATFKQRATGFPQDIPALTESFATGKQAQWQAFLARSMLADAPPQLQEAIQVIDQFARPVLAACQSGTDFDKRWKPGGPWRKAAARKT
jgi:hypothetical protein